MLNYKGFDTRRRIHPDLHGRVRVLGFGLQAERSGLVIAVARGGKIFKTEEKRMGSELAREMGR